jgi:DNA-binding transcriptional regulator LsrR (DeoR family)
LLADGAAGTVEFAMVAAANMVEVAALVGDTARATILAALMGGQALTGSELAFRARISRPTASEHLTKLVEARLVAVTKNAATAITASHRLWWQGCLNASRR